MTSWNDIYSFGEATTACGAMMRIEAKQEDLPTIKEAIGKAKSISIPSIRSVSDGGGMCFTRYNIEKSDYTGGNNEAGGRIIEVLHIKDAPDDRCPYVVHQYSYWGPGFYSHTFSEWETLAAAKKARSAHAESKEKCASMEGFIRFVDCGQLTPWFYAVGNEPLIQDVAIHSGFEEHPIYRLGRRFLISQEKSGAHVVTCMGAQRYSYQEPSGWWENKITYKFYWVIIFSDGSHLHLDEEDKITSRSLFGSESRTIHPLPEGEIWQDDLFKQFAAILSGEKLGGIIKFDDGSMIEVRYKPKGKKAPDAPGKYYVRATRRQGEIKEGNMDFTPDNEYSATTVVEFILKKSEASTPDNPYVRVEVIRRSDGVTKRWLGVWYKLSR